MDRPPAQRFEDLVVWQKGHALVLGVYLAYHAESCIFEQLEEVSRLLDSYTRRVLPNRDVF